jgi:ATP-dependent helicase/DNAse subunit B
MSASAQQEESHEQTRPNSVRVTLGNETSEKENPQAEKGAQCSGLSLEPAARKEEEMNEQSQEKPHLSYSQVNTYLACPLRYRFHYIDQIEPPFVSAALAFGSCIHEAVAAFHQSCLEGDPLTASQLIDVYSQVWSSHSAERPVRFFNGESEEKLTVKAKGMLEV